MKPQQRQDLDVVISAAYALLAIINNVLDFSKIEAGKLDLEETAFDPREILEESLRIMAMRCHDERLGTDMPCCSECSEYLSTEIQRGFGRFCSTW